MDELFVVAWTGGYELPQYAVKATKDEAFKLAREWFADAKEGEDTVDVLRIDITAMTIERLDASAEPDTLEAT